MRKQDRINREQNQDSSDQHGQEPQRRPDERVKGSASADEQSNRPPRESGRLPLPE